MTKDIASKVAQADYDAYTAATDAALAAKVESETYEAFVSANTEALAEKVEVETYNAYTAATDAAIAKKVEVETYNAYTAATDAALAEKLDVSAHTAYTTTTDAALAKKVEVETYEAFVSANTESLAAKVAQADYDAYTAATDAALAAKVESETYEAKITEIEKSITDNKSAADEAIKDLQDNKADVNDVVLKEGYVAYSEEEKTKLAGIAENAQVNAIETITLFGNELEINDKTVAVDFQADDIKLGTAITTVENGESKDVFGADKTLSQTLQGIYDSLKSGLSGGVTSVTGADDSIVVSGDVNNREVKVQVSAAADNRLSIRTVDGEKGLYVEPLYYGGDDEEVE